MTEIDNDILTKQGTVIDQFKRIIEKNQLSHAYLLTGESGLGKLAVAKWVAKRLFCINLQDGFPCNECQECVRINENQHPDVFVIEPDGQSIKVDQVRFLKSEFSKSGVESSQKVFIISEAHKMTSGAANSLLKFIEEPVGNVTAFLLSDNKNLMLPTIVSRTEVIELKPLNAEQLEQQFIELGVPNTIVSATTKITNSQAEVELLLENDWLQNAYTGLKDWFNALVKGDRNSFVLVQTRLLNLGSDRFHQEKLIDFLTLFPRDLLEIKVSDQHLSFPDQSNQFTVIAERHSVKTIIAALDLALQMRGQLASNINFQSILESTTIKLFNLFESEG